jgi:hypothetical protein
MVLSGSPDMCSHTLPEGTSGCLVTAALWLEGLSVWRDHLPLQKH